MSKRLTVGFVTLEAATLAMPWLMLFFGRGVVRLFVFLILLLLLLVSTVVIFRKHRRLATSGIITLLLTLLSMMLVPSYARGP